MNRIPVKRPDTAGAVTSTAIVEISAPSGARVASERTRSVRRGLLAVETFATLARVAQQAFGRVRFRERKMAGQALGGQEVARHRRLAEVVSERLRSPLSERGRLLFALVPTLVMFWAGACFVWNHFLVGPYLLDSGWLSALTYRDGLFPDNPPCAHSLQEYYGLHVTPLVSLGSLLSYVVPLERVPYYCLFQGLIYAPLGALTALLAHPKGLDTSWGGATIALVGALVFALNGQVLACLGYPHFEIFMSAGLCVMLAGFAAGSRKLAWLGLLMAAATREDGGLHALAFVSAALAVDLSGRPFPFARRHLLHMAGAAALSSILAIGTQRIFFEPANLFVHQYLGEPAFSHITGALLQKRLTHFPDEAAFIAYPLAGTLVLAIIARDARYLLGWLVELPWLLLNLLAVEDLKAAFSVYTGFPFVASMFWVGAYGQVGRGVIGKQRWLGALSTVSLLSTLGLYLSHPGPFLSTIRTAAVPLDVPYAGLAEFAENMERDPTTYGRVLVDRSVTAWAINGIPRERCVSSLMRVEAPNSYDGIVFFKRGGLSALMPRFLEKSPYSQCGRIPQTDVFMCRRPGGSLPSPFEASSFGS
jgi:hypothetical protein